MDRNKIIIFSIIAVLSNSNLIANMYNRLILEFYNESGLELFEKSLVEKKDELPKSNHIKKDYGNRTIYQLRYDFSKTLNQQEIKALFDGKLSLDNREIKRIRFENNIDNSSCDISHEKPVFKYKKIKNVSTNGISWTTLALINAAIAQSKNRSGFKWFLGSLFLGPLATFALVIS